MSRLANKDTSASLQIEQVPIDQLHPDPANPRRISEEELESLTRSIRQFGLVDPVIARAEDKTVIGGHQRLLAARKLGLERVPVIYLDLDTERARLLNVALNKIAGSFDEELLARLLKDLETETTLDLTLTGFGEDDLQKLLRSLETREKRDKPEQFDLDAALEEAQRSPRVKPGEVWKLGPHRLLCGDATKPVDVGRLMDDDKAQMTFTDPPYNVSLGDHGGQQQGQKKRRIANDALAPEEWEAFCQSWAANLLAHTDGALYVCMSSKELPLVSRVLEEADGHWSDTLIWAKDRFVLGRADYQRGYEPIWYGWREGADHQWHGDRKQSDVWQVARPATSEAHPTMKPLALIERALENSSRAGDVVLDPFLGSGSTLIACERTGRTCYGAEIDAHYSTIVLARWEQFTAGRAEKVED